MNSIESTSYSVLITRGISRYQNTNMDLGLSHLLTALCRAMIDVVSNFQSSNVISLNIYSGFSNAVMKLKRWIILYYSILRYNIVIYYVYRTIQRYRSIRSGLHEQDHMPLYQ